MQFHICINPEIEDAQGEIIFEEACLSIPTVQEKVTRKEKLHLSYQDLEGNKKKLKTEKLQSVCKHEIDSFGWYFIY